MIDILLRVKFLIILLMILSAVTINVSVYAQKESELGSGINVTQDMIDLLLDNPTKDNFSTPNEIKSNISNTLAQPQLQKATSANSNKITIQLPPIFLEDKTLPEGNVLYIYDITPWIIQQGHLTIKTPCNEENLPAANVLVGKMPNFQTLNLDLVPEFSDPGDLCLYQSNLMLNQTGPVSEILLGNNSSEDIEFPPSSSLSLSISNLTDNNM